MNGNVEYLWNVRKIELQDAAVKALLDLFAHTEAYAVLLPVPNTDPQLFVAAGEKPELQKLLSLAPQEGER